jgi:uncharacterized protein YjbJ (UPF0337 family)
MINQTTLKGNWNELKGKLRSHWGQLTNDDIQTFNGNVEQLVGLIERKTGESRAAVEEFLDRLTANGSASMGTAVEDARQYVEDAAERIQHRSRQAMDSLREGYGEAEEMVRQRPSESVAICFGVGVFVGLLFGLSLRGR